MKLNHFHPASEQEMESFGGVEAATFSCRTVPTICSFVGRYAYRWEIIVMAADTPDKNQGEVHVICSRGAQVFNYFVSELDDVDQAERLSVDLKISLEGQSWLAGKAVLEEAGLEEC